MAKVDWGAWALPPVFAWLREVGGVEDAELRRTFNCGMGFMLIVSPGDADQVLSGLLAAGEAPFVCGELVRQD